MNLRKRIIIQSPESGTNKMQKIDESNNDPVSNSESEQNSDDDEEYEDDDEEYDNIKYELDKIKKKGSKMLHNAFSDVKKELERTEPNIKELLLTPLRIEDRTKLCNIYNIYKNHSAYTDEWLDSRDRYNTLFKQYKHGYIEYMKISEEDHIKFKKEEESLTGFDTQLALKFKILSLNTNKENKSVIYRRYEEFVNCKDEEYGKIKHWLKWATDIPHDNIKENKVNDITEFIKMAGEKLDKELFGMKKIKEQILFFLSAKIINPNMKRSNLGLVGPPGVGKCLARDTPVVMFNGTIKKVQDINVGDRLLGDDSTPRMVLSLARGREKMYKIHQVNGDPYTVNESHILSLKVVSPHHIVKFIKNKKYTNNDILDISVKDYIELSEYVKSTLKGFKVGVEFPEKEVPYDPYIIGSWLGECSYSTSKIATTDSENIWNILYTLDLINKKHIPYIYYYNSRNVRLKLLAGLLDSDAYYISKTNTYKIKNNNIVMVKHIVLLCRSLGFYLKYKKIHGSYHIYISGSGIDEIPVLLTYKKARKNNKQLHTDIILEPKKTDDYYGFVIDGNHRFLLGDFTVTHNTSIARMIADLLDSGFEQISFGGTTKADFLKGHDYTYIGAQPGEIVKCLKRMGNKNGIIFLDELDKASENPDISAALLHLVDQSQNCDFRDNFLSEISIDLSHIWYIGSMNKIPSDEALADRWWIIEVDGYTSNDKIQIIENYLLPKALKNTNMPEFSVVFNKDSVLYFIDKVSSPKDKGVRNIQKAIADLINKLHFIVTHQNDNGQIPFISSFKLKEKLIYPIVLSSHLINTLLEHKEIHNFLNMIYI